MERSMLTEPHPVPVKSEKESQLQHSAPRLPQQKHNMLALKERTASNPHPKEYHQIHYTACIYQHNK